MRRVWLGGAWIATVALAYLLGSRGHEAPPAAAVRERAASVPSTLTAADVRVIVRGELAQHAVATTAAAAAASASASASAEAPPAPEPSPRFPEARALAESALARGHWTEDDRAQLRIYLAGLHKAEIDEIFATLIPAVNGGQLKVDYFGPPL